MVQKSSEAQLYHSTAILHLKSDYDSYESIPGVDRILELILWRTLKTKDETWDISIHLLQDGLYH